jgi:hypothetical protein
MRFPSLALTAALVAAGKPATAQTTIANYKQGQVTFTQGGQTATWVLWQGSADRMAAGSQTVTQVSLIYTPNGKFRGTGGPESSLRTTVSRMGDYVGVVVLAVQQGPGGNGILRLRGASCTATLARVDSAGAEGSGTCTGQFEGGGTVTKFAFTAKP